MSIEKERVQNRMLNAIERHKFIEDTITYIRQFGFRCIDTEPFFEEVAEQKKRFKIKIDRVQFMARYIGAKDQRYDLSLVFAIKFWGKKNDFFSVYKDGVVLKKFYKPWKDSADINFRKMYKKWSFPDELTYQQRRDWRAEHKKVINPNTSYEGSAFYHQWKDKVIVFDKPKPI